QAVAEGQQLAHADGAAPPEDRWLGDPSVRALWPQLFQSLLLEPRWLMRYARVTTNQARELTRFGAFAGLARLREQTARLDFNMSLLDRGGAGGAEDAWVERIRRALQAESSGSDAWAAIEPSLHVVHALRAAAFVTP